MEEQDSQVPALYKHSKRPEWGLAMQAWEADGKRAYQFEDGQLRVFKAGFYDLMEKVEQPVDRTQRALARLDRALGRSEAKGPNEELIPIDNQIAMFRESHPEGFAGEEWINKTRGTNAAKPLKRHRDPAITRAQEALAQARLKSLLDEQNGDEIVKIVRELLGETSLVSASHIKPLSKIADGTAFGNALYELLYGEEGDFRQRFDRLVLCIPDKPSWELVTSFAAMVQPEEHVCVRPAVFKEQACWMAPRLEHVTRPEGEVYVAYLAMAQAVRNYLADAGLGPKDLLDVHDFIYETLRPAARKILRQKKEKPAEAEAEA